MVHAALRQVLGPNAVQAGSLNKPGYLRFDFSWPGGALSEQQKQDIEAVTNEAVAANYPVNTFVTDLDKAKKMGAMALFGENYGDEVRVVEIGGPFSMELCGGTHVQHSSHIGTVTLLGGEQSVGSGVRRVEAYVGLDSYRHLAKNVPCSPACPRRSRCRPRKCPVASNRSSNASRSPKRSSRRPVPQRSSPRRAPSPRRPSGSGGTCW